MKLFRIATAGLLGGAALLGTAWAGVGLTPVSVPDPTAVTEVAPASSAGESASKRPAVDAGVVQVGASKVSMYPRPEEYADPAKGEYWERDYETCKTFDLGPPRANAADHLASTGSPWNENPNCIYVGGFDIGPVNPVVEFDTEYGLWVRSIAISDGADTTVLTIVDAEGYLWDYKSKCERCGAKQLAEDLGAELGIDPSGFVIAATHAHSAPDLIGGWGFVPDWYMAQVTDAIEQSIRDAVAGMVPATIEFGEVEAREHNSDRRDTYRSAEEQQLTWFRATAAQPPRKVIATVGAYAGHPTTKGAGGGTAHPDWVGLFEAGLEQRFGGIGLHFMTGLGNMSTSGGTQMGERLAALVPDVGDGTPLTETDLRVEQETWEQPTTNVPLDALGLPGFFDREFLLTPSSVRTGKSPDTAPCASTSPFTVELPASAARFGDQLAITAAPGEVFSNLTNTLKEQSRAEVTMPLAQANDALGYMPQSFELNPVGQQGLGFVAGGFLIVNYEDSYAVDRCVGDMVLETTIGLLDELR
jgi:hypothetical protein